MKKNLKKYFKKIFNVIMVVGILITSFPLTPFVTKVNALGTVSGDKIVEAAMSYQDWEYGEVGTCTGLVTRAFNKVGIGESIVGIHPYDIDKPQADGTGARYSPDGMYRNAMNHPEDAQHIWSGYVGDIASYAHLFKNGDLVIQRPEDRATYTGSGHVGIIRIYDGKISMYGANGSKMGIGDAVLFTRTRGLAYDVSPLDYINVFRLTVAEPEYGTLTSTKSSNEVVDVLFSKTDKDTGKPLSGVEVDFYRDDVKFASGITDSNGNAVATSIVTYTSTSSIKTYCKNYNDLADAEKQLVDSQGAFHSQVEAQASADSEAQLSANDKASKTHKYSVVEVKTKTKYWLNPDNTTDSDSATGSGRITLSLTNERVRGTAILNKVDYDVEYAQNEAVLDGALYGLYARENILDPADGSIIYSKDTEITRVRIKDGTAKVEDLYLGAYYWKEITSSKGYSLDKTQINFDLTYSGQDIKNVTATSTSKEKVITADFEIEKIITSGDESEIVEKEEGSEFLVVAKKYVDKYGTIEEAWNHRDEFTEKEYDKLITSKQGYDKTRPLAFGDFVVKQIKGKIDTENVKDSWIFTVSEENQDTIKYIVNNRRFTSYVKLQKYDKDTRKLITLSNTSFKIKNADTLEYLSQKVGDKTYTIWKTGNKGEIQLPLELKAGNWILEEIESPNYYLINEEAINFKVTNSNIIETDSDGEPLLTVAMYDKPVKGRVKVEKKGEVLTGIETDENGNIQFIYEEKYLDGMVVNIQADENIIDPADGSIIYKKGEIVDTVTTSSTEETFSKLLPLGKYIAYEYKAPEGMVLDTNKYEINLEFKDNKTEIITETISITNQRQKVDLNLLKLDEEKEIALEGVVFNLSTTKDIFSYDGELLVEKGTVIEEGITDSKGSYIFKADLPISLDNENYFELKEVQAKEGYYLNDEILEVDTSYKGHNILTISNDNIIYNKPIKNYVLVNKIDDKTLENIISKDFKFILCNDSECKNIIKEYNADIETGTALIDIYFGEWYIKESSAPEGYALSPEIVKVVLNVEGLFINDKRVETDEDLLYSIRYQNTLLPVIQEDIVQTGYDDNLSVISLFMGASLISIVLVSCSLIRKSKSKKKNK